jgi:PleD family two-component response regulator
MHPNQDISQVEPRMARFISEAEALTREARELGLGDEFAVQHFQEQLHALKEHHATVRTSLEQARQEGNLEALIQDLNSRRAALQGLNHLCAVMPMREKLQAAVNRARRN